MTNGWGLLELRAQQMSLEDIFLQLTTEEEGGSGEPDGTDPGGPPEVAAGENGPGHDGGAPDEAAEPMEAEERTNG